MLTNAHVVKGCTDVNVALRESDRVPAKILAIGDENGTNPAVLQADSAAHW